MKSVDQRLNNVIGQIEGVKKMVSRKESCDKVLTQLKAVKAAINGVMDSVIEEQLCECMKSMNSDERKMLLKIKKQFSNL